MDGSQPIDGASVANQSTDTKAGIEGGHAYQDLCSKRIAARKEATETAIIQSD